jgi:hypothetical protein
VALAAAWVAVTAGFVAYLAGLDSFRDAYGSVGTGAVLLVWITLLSVLFHLTPRLRRARAEGPTATAVARALQSPAAQGRLLSVMGPRTASLSRRELEMVDWGFVFGVAWAVARRQDPGAPEAVVSARALRVASAAQPHPRRD